MATARFWTFLLSTACPLFAACTSDDGTSAGSDDTADAPTPTIAITSPKDSAEVTVEAEEEGTALEAALEVEFKVTHFKLAEPGKCGDAEACGHVQSKIDGNACNDTEEDGEKEPFNEEFWKSPGDADFLYCPGVVISPKGITGIDGKHEITLLLANDDESPVKNADGKVIQASIHVTVELEAGGEEDAGAD